MVSDRTSLPCRGRRRRPTPGLQHPALQKNRKKPEPESGGEHILEACAELGSFSVCFASSVRQRSSVRRSKPASTWEYHACAKRTFQPGIPFPVGQRSTG